MARRIIVQGVQREELSVKTLINALAELPRSIPEPKPVPAPPPDSIHKPHPTHTHDRATIRERPDTDDEIAN